MGNGRCGGVPIFFTWLSSSWLDLVIADVKWHPIAFTMGLEACQQATASTRQLEHFPGWRIAGWRSAKPHQVCIADDIIQLLWPFSIILANEGNGTLAVLITEVIVIIIGIIIIIFCFWIHILKNWFYLFQIRCILTNWQEMAFVQLAVSLRGPDASAVPASFTHKTTVAFDKQSCTMCF